MVGKQIHKMIPDRLLNNVFVLNALINMYSKCGRLEEAIELFNTMGKYDKNAITWNIMMSGYLTHGRRNDALMLFEQMRSDGIEADANTYSIVLTACADMRNIDVGQKIYKMIPIRLLDSVFVKSSLINLYSKYGRLEEAIKVFAGMGKNDKNTITYNTMILGYAHGRGGDALALFEQMRSDGIEADANTYNIVLTACADIGCLDVGQKIHSIIPDGLLGNIFVKSSLINMYSKCGRIEEAIKIFDGIGKNDKDVVVWTAMISGYGTHGRGRHSIALFDQMIMDGVKPNSITFVALLTACSHNRLIDDALELYYSMFNKYGVKPDDMHRNCLVDALSRAGQLEKAEA